MRKDLIAALFCLALAAFLFFSLGWIDDERARSFPRVIIIIMGVLSLLLLLQTLLVEKASKPTKDKPFAWRVFGSMLALILIYFFFMEKIGFYVSALVFFIVVSLVFSKARPSSQRLLVCTGMGVGFTGIIYFLFNIILKVQTPTGLLL